MGWKQLMEQQFPQARRRCHIIEAKVQAPVELEPSHFSRNENSVECAVNAMSVIYSAARPRHQTPISASPVLFPHEQIRPR